MAKGYTRCDFAVLSDIWWLMFMVGKCLRISAEIKSHFSDREEYIRLPSIFPGEPKINPVSEI